MKSDEYISISLGVEAKKRLARQRAGRLRWGRWDEGLYLYVGEGLYLYVVCMQDLVFAGFATVFAAVRLPSVVFQINLITRATPIAMA
jgi:hypothetical protein